MKNNNFKMKIIFFLCIVATFFIFADSVFAKTGKKDFAKKSSTIKKGKKQTAVKKAKEADISFDFDQVDIRVFIKFISELTNKNFIVDEKVRGKVTVISPKKISKKEAYRVFETILEVHGYSMVKAGNLTKIVPSASVRRMNIETKTNKRKYIKKANDEIVTQIIPLKYADVNDVKALFAPLVSKSGMILSYNPTNTLFLTDVYSNITRLLKILRQIDIKGVAKEVTIIPLRHSDAKKVIKIVSTVFKRKKKSSSFDEAFFIADENANAIIIISAKSEIKKIEQVIEKLDRTIPKGSEKINVYYLENAAAEELSGVLQSLTKSGSNNKDDVGVISSKVRIIPDKSTNSLIITADKDEYEVVCSIIRKLDVQRAMVYIESLIIEVEAGNSFDFGASIAAGSASGSIKYGGASGLGSSAGVLASGIGIGSVPNSLSGFSLGIFDKAITIGNMTFSNLAGAIKAFRSKTGYNILSTPQIMTLNNESAKISVGDNIPYTTRAASSIDGSFAYEYKDVGVTLEVTPQISHDKKIKLKINQEVKTLTQASASDTKTSQDVRLPTTKTKTINTTVIVNDGATIVLGGLIGEESQVSKDSIPCLADIPFLGVLFRSTSETKKKTNLYIFLTPRIVSNPQEARELYEERKESKDKIVKETISLFSNNSNDEKSSFKLKYIGTGNKDSELNNAKKVDVKPAKMPLKLQKYNSSSVESFIKSIGRSEYELEEEMP